MATARGRVAPMAVKRGRGERHPAGHTGTGKRDAEIPAQGAAKVPDNQRTPKDAHKAQMARQPEKRADYRTLWQALRDLRDRFATHNAELYEGLSGILIAVTPPAFGEQGT